MVQEAGEINRDLEFVRAAASHMVQEVIHTIAVEELLEAGAGPKDHALTTELQARFDHTEIVPTLTLFQLVMRREITLCMTRLHDGPQRGRMSFGEVFRKLDKSGTRDVFLREQEARARYHYNQDVEKWLEALKARWSQGIEQEYSAHLAMLRDARNIFLAHGVDENPKLPTYQQLFDFVSFTAELVEGLGAITGVYLNGFDETRRIKRSLALSFWSALIQSSWQSDRALAREVER